jgi:hypothetical protein
MAMSIELKPETETLVQQELQNGHFHTVDEMIVEGVRARREGMTVSGQAPRKTPAEAAAHIRQMRRGNRLPPGVTIKDLTNEGRA